jgi:hypothetical protein
MALPRQACDRKHRLAALGQFRCAATQREPAAEGVMDGFTPFSALVGGVLIGASSALLLMLNGRIAGFSGILGGLPAMS